MWTVPAPERLCSCCMKEDLLRVPQSSIPCEGVVTALLIAVRLIHRRRTVAVVGSWLRLRSNAHLLDVYDELTGL